LPLLAYPVKPSKGTPKFAARLDVRFLNRCSDLAVAVKKPVSLLVPSQANFESPVDPPLEPNLDHFLCYDAKLEKKLAYGSPVTGLPKGTQVVVGDLFSDWR